MLERWCVAMYKGGDVLTTCVEVNCLGRSAYPGGPRLTFAFHQCE